MTAVRSIENTLTCKKSLIVLITHKVNLLLHTKNILNIEIRFMNKKIQLKILLFLQLIIYFLPVPTKKYSYKELDWKAFKNSNIH